MAAGALQDLDRDEVDTTRGEKLLALILTVFVLVGALWVYVKIDDAVRPAPPYSSSGLFTESTAAASRAEAARQQLAAVDRELARVEGEMAAAREAAREDADVRPPGLPTVAESAAQGRALYERREVAQAALDRAQGDVERAMDEWNAQSRRATVVTFFLRLVWVVGFLAAGYALMSRLRRQGSRYQPGALAVVGAAAVQVLVMAADYTENYVDVEEYGALLVSLAGIGLTMAAMVGLHRYVTRRKPLHRARRGQCPFCGWPARGPHCEGCGRAVASECGTCGEERLMATPHCAACGAV